MERNLSLEHLEGLWRLGQVSGIGRTDSEAAFQDFLKRIPSIQNLSAAANEPQQNTLTPSTTIATGGSSTSSLPISDLSTSLGGIPRVPSLDFLRQLGQVVNQQQFPSPTTNGAHIKPEQTATVPGLAGLAGLSPADLAALSSASLTAAALQAAPPLNTTPLPLTTAAANPLAAAAALQFGQLNQQLRLAAAATTPAAPQQEKAEPVEKQEIRKARRMLSNRESARRSRRRKQEHMMSLEQQLLELKEDYKDLEDKFVDVERRCFSAEDENKRLREENDRLREELRFLRPEQHIAERKVDRNGYHKREKPASPRREEGALQHKRHHGALPSEQAAKGGVSKEQDHRRFPSSRHDELVETDTNSASAEES